jgi:hypothetical protein
LDAGLTYVDDRPAGVRSIPLYEERYLLLTPSGGELAERTVVRWAAAGATVVPAIETDTVSALYAHVATRRWSSVIAHAWLHLFGVPTGKRVVPLESPPRSPQIGLVVAAGLPDSRLARALLLHRHLVRQQR